MVQCAFMQYCQFSFFSSISVILKTIVYIFIITANDKNKDCDVGACVSFLHWRAATGMLNDFVTLPNTCCWTTIVTGYLWGKGIKQEADLEILNSCFRSHCYSQSHIQYYRSFSLNTLTHTTILILVHYHAASRSLSELQHHWNDCECERLANA